MILDTLNTFIQPVIGTKTYHDMTIKTFTVHNKRTGVTRIKEIAVASLLPQDDFNDYKYANILENINQVS